jgi:hypothetical protein
MIKPDTIVASVSFILFVITNVMGFFRMIKNISTLSIFFCTFLTGNFLLWTLHGYLANDLVLMCSSIFGILISLCLIYAKAKSR